MRVLGWSESTESLPTQCLPITPQLSCCRTFTTSTITKHYSFESTLLLFIIVPVPDPAVTRKRSINCASLWTIFVACLSIRWGRQWTPSHTSEIQSAPLSFCRHTGTAITVARSKRETDRDHNQDVAQKVYDNPSRPLVRRHHLLFLGYRKEVHSIHTGTTVYRACTSACTSIP